jgi:hypothetical protein
MAAQWQWRWQGARDVGSPASLFIVEVFINLVGDDFDGDFLDGDAAAAMLLLLELLIRGVSCELDGPHLQS